MGGASPYLSAVRAEHVGPAARPLRFALLEPPGLGALLSVPLDGSTKLPSYSMARVANESDEFLIRAPFPVTNVSPADDPMPPVPDSNTTADDPDWRPTLLLGVYTEAGVRGIVNWFAEMEKYETDGRARGGRGLKRPGELILGDEFVQPKACGRPWYTHKKTHIEKSKSHKRREKDTSRVRYPTKDSARGAQCAARRSPTQKLPPTTALFLFLFCKARCPRQRESIYRRGAPG